MSPLPQSAIEVVPDQVYASHDGTALRADAYLPAGRGPYPAIVLYHGGAWVKGSRSTYEPWGCFLAARNYVAVAVDYRLATSARPAFPENVWDAKAAVQWVRANHRALRVDPGRLAVMGGSAGAHLAAMVALTASLDELRNPYPDPFAGEAAGASVVIAMAGPYDLLHQWEYDLARRPPGQSPTEAYLGGTPMSTRARYFLASPRYHASTDNAAGTRWLLAWGTDDEVVSPEHHSLAFSRELRLAGALVRHAPLVGVPHYWYLDSDVEEPNSVSALFTQRLLAFLRTWSGLEPAEQAAPR